MRHILIDTLVKDKREKIHLLNAIKTVPSVQKKAEWALKWCDANNASFCERLVAFAAVEGIFFSGSFVPSSGSRNAVSCLGFASRMS